MWLSALASMTAGDPLRALVSVLKLEPCRRLILLPLEQPAPLSAEEERYVLKPDVTP